MTDFIWITRRLSAALAAALFAFCAAAEVPQAARDAQIIVLGEQHDNPAHHERQAMWVAELMPRALVFEMLTAEQAARGNAAPARDLATLDAALQWTGGPWPDFALYHPIIDVVPQARLYGAWITRPSLKPMLDRPLSTHPRAAAFGFDHTPEADEQAHREALQADAHCGALPAEMLPMMVDAQRLRDMALAEAALDAVRQTGGPVAIITGNGHARADWGVPALLAISSPDLRVFSLAQSEDGDAVAGDFDLILDAPAPPRNDPCAAFAD